MNLAGSKPGLANNSILFCLLFTFKDQCKISAFSTNTQSRFASVVDGVSESEIRSLRTTYTNLDCVFVENALLYTDP